MNLNGFSRMNRLLERRQEAFEETGALGECTFDRDNGQVPQLETARNYVRHWEDMNQEGLGLILWGMPGSGKTFAAACIANALMEQDRRVRMVTLSQVLNRLPALSAEDRLYYLEKLQSCELLILDDFGMERRTDYAREQIFSIVNGRYLSRKPMVLTTNLPLETLKNPTDLASRRIYDRVMEVCVPVAFNAGSLRQARARENMQRYRHLADNEGGS